MALKIATGPLQLGKGAGLQIKAASAAAPTLSYTTGLLRWYKADAGTSTTTNGVALTSWADQSGNGANATIASGGPTYTTAWQNGLPGITFAQAGNIHLDFTSTGTLANWTAFVVYDATSFDAGVNYLVGGNAHGIFSKAAVLGVGFGSFDGANDRRSNADSMAVGVRCYQPAKLFLNGTEVTYASTGTMTGMQLGRLGGRTDTGSVGHNGRIGEVLVYDSTLSTANRNIVEAYLKAKWNTP